MKERKNLTFGAMSILEKLSVFQFMTPLQMVNARVSPSIKTVRDKLISQLVKRQMPLVHAYDFGVLPKVGRLSKIYCLSRHGAALLAESWGVDVREVPYPKYGVQFANDYFHRVICVDFHIAFRNWIEDTDGEVFLYDNYFGKVRAQDGYTSQTAVVLKNGLKVIPDSVAMFNDNRMFALEVHNSKQTAKIIRQLENHLTAIQERAISVKYNHPRLCPVLSLFTYKGTMEATKKRLLEQRPELIDLKKGFLFNTLDDVKADLRRGWHLIDNSEAPFFG